MRMTSSYKTCLDEAENKGLLRRCRTVTADGGWPELRVDDQPAIDFCSNDYLGLSQDPRLKAVARAAVERQGVGAGSSRLVSGTSRAMIGLEEALANFKQTEAALVFNSGYQANVAILQALLEPGDWVFLDRLNHASLLDGCRLSGARWIRYRHLDMNHLESRLKRAPREARKWIVTDTLFSMDGDCADLPALADLADRYGAMVMVDEAHATGLFGAARSSGLAEAHDVSQRIALQMGTFSKALGGFGAYVAGSRRLMQLLVNRARGFVYSTALPPPVIAAARQAVDIVRNDPSLKTRLWENVAAFKPRLEALLLERGLPVPAFQSQIFPVIIGPSAMAVCEGLLEKGLYVQGIRPPTVPAGMERLRITLSARHTPQQLETLLASLSSVLRQA